MSALERAVTAIDEARKVQRVPDINFLDYLKNRQTETDKIKRVEEFRDEVVAMLENGSTIQGATMPWTKTHDLFRFRGSEVTMWQGYNGHGKSMVLGYISLGLIAQHQPVCIASFEMRPQSTIMRMLKQATGAEHPTPFAYQQFVNFCQDKFWIYDKQGMSSPEILYGVMYYAAEKLGVKHFVIDSLMRVIGGEEDYDGQKNFVSRLCDIALETNLHIHLVHHNRKGDESKMAGRYGAKGSGSLSDNVHNTFEVWKDRRENKPEEAPDVILNCDKHREGDWQGNIGLWFIPGCLQYSGTSDRRVRSWI